MPNVLQKKYFGNFLFYWLNVLPVVVHIANEHGVEGVKVPAEYSKLIQDKQLSLLVIAFTVSLQQLLLTHNLQFRCRAVVKVSTQSKQLVTVIVTK